MFHSSERGITFHSLCVPNDAAMPFGIVGGIAAEVSAKPDIEETRPRLGWKGTRPRVRGHTTMCVVGTVSRGGGPTKRRFALKVGSVYTCTNSRMEM